jgi:hypothetical protein
MEGKSFFSTIRKKIVSETRRADTLLKIVRYG